MNKLTDKLVKLVDLKSIMTVFIIGTICFLAIRQNITIESETLTLLLGSITAYYFTRKDN